MPATRLTEYLDSHSVKYVIIRHSPAYTATDVAALSHVAARDFAKTLVIKVDGLPAMLVMPASRRLLLHELREMMGTMDVGLASESDMRRLFPDCEVGAMPPFGNLYGLDVYVTGSLTREPTITFNAGTHTEVIKMGYEDFDRFVRPRVIDLVTT